MDTLAERTAIGKIQIDRLYLGFLAWRFCPNSHRNTFIRLDTYGQPIRLYSSRRHACQKNLRNVLELDIDLGQTLRHAFARADVERNPSPAPVFAGDLKRDICFGHRVGFDTWLLAISWDRFAVGIAVDVLRSDCE